MINTRAVAALVLVAMIIGCGSPDDPKSREIATWVIEQGGYVTIVGSGLKYDRISKLPEEEFAVQGIDLNRQSVTNADLERFTSLTQLNTLGLYGSSVGDKGMDHLARIKTLSSLELSYTNVSAKSLEALGTLPNLQKLYLYGVPLSAEVLDEFRRANPDCTVYHDG